MAAPGDRDLESLLSRVSLLEDFRPLQARRVLRALCHVAPERLPEHLKLLHEHLQARYQPSACRYGGRRWSERQALAGDVVRAVRKDAADALAAAYEEYTERESASHAALGIDWFASAVNDDPALLHIMRRLSGRSQGAAIMQTVSGEATAVPPVSRLGRPQSTIVNPATAEALAEYR